MTVIRRSLAPLSVLALLLVALPAAAPADDGTYLPPGAPTAVTDADYYDAGAPDPAQVELGRLLFFDKILSGNRNISCATCHHSLTGTGDGLSLSIGEGGLGLGVTRDTGHDADAVVERVPRNAPSIWNLGAREFTVMFHDGRLAVDPTQPRGFLSPAGEDLPPGLDNVLAAQAMFPVTSAAEMAGEPGENAIADAAAAGDLPALWALLAERLRAIPGYVDRFVEVYDDVEQASDITYVHAANAIAAFEAVVWRADNSPFDRHLRGDGRAMSQAAKRGMGLFYRRGGCGECHSGKFLTDHDFHAIATPQLGPGKGDGPFGDEDFGRERVTGDPADRYRFRTPSLRNVAINGPWGHAGSFGTLRAAVEHHLDAVASLLAWDRSQVSLPSRPDLDEHDFAVMDDPLAVQAIADANQLPPVALTPQEVNDLMDFLHALTDPMVFDLRLDVPPSVPSGLPVFD